MRWREQNFEVESNSASAPITPLQKKTLEERKQNQFKILHEADISSLLKDIYNFLQQNARRFGAWHKLFSARTPVIDNN